MKMKNRIAWSAVCLIVLLMLFACSGGGDCDSEGSEPLSVDFSVPINGTWLSICSSDTKTMYTMNAGQITATFLGYKGGCLGFMAALPIFDGQYELGNPYRIPSCKVAQEITIVKSDGRTIYDIVYIEGDTLYFGDSAGGDKSSAANRPAELDSINYYTRN